MRLDNERIRNENARIKADHENLKAQLEELIILVHDIRKDAAIQFVRIAQVQAILDEERRVNPPTEPNPLIRRPKVSSAS